MKKLRVIGYTRVSTLEQSREGVSLDNQEHKIRAYADLKDMELVEMIVEEGKSGKTMNRPGLQRIINLINKKQIDIAKEFATYKFEEARKKNHFLDVFKILSDMVGINPLV